MSTKIELSKGIWVEISAADHIQGMKPGQLVGPNDVPEELHPADDEFRVSTGHGA